MGLAETHGAAQIQDGTSNTVLIAERVPTTASCADTDEDGVGGLTLLPVELGRPRRKSAEPSSSDSLRDGLFDQLLSSLQQEGEPPASEKEVFAWARAHSGRCLPMDDTACPWPIRRCHALMILRALTAEVCERLDQALAESEETEFDHEERFDHAIAESEQAEFDREESRRKWRERREGTIETFHLAGLVDEEAPSV